MSDQINDALKATLIQRGQLYSPLPGRRWIQGEMTDRLMDVIRPMMPAGLPDGSDFDTLMMVNKLTRALELAWNGGYHGDNMVDFGGYNACLAARVQSRKQGREVKPEEVI